MGRISDFDCKSMPKPDGIITFWSLFLNNGDSRIKLTLLKKLYFELKSGSMKYFLVVAFAFFNLNLKATNLFKTLNSGNIEFTSSISDNDSTAIFAGQSLNSPSSGILVRINKIGDIIWSKQFSDSLSVKFNQLTFNFDSTKIVVAGEITDTTDHASGLLLELDLDGNLIWQKSYDVDTIKTSFTTLSFTAENKLAISAMITYESLGNYYAVIFIADSSGTIYKKLPYENFDPFSAPIVMSDGTLFLTGIEYNIFDNACYNYGMNIDSGLSIINWKTNYYEANSEPGFTKVGPKNILLKNGNIIFSFSHGTWQSCPHFKTLEIDPAGNVLWVSQGGPGVTVLSDGSIFVEQECYNHGFFRMDSTGSSYTNYDLISGNLMNPGITSIGNQLILLTDNGFLLMDSSSCNVVNTGTQSDSGFTFTSLPQLSLPLLTTAQTFPHVNSNLVASGGPNFHIDCGSTLISKSEAPHLRIFPNPASEELNIEINFLQSKIIAYSVSDISGKIILSAKFILSTGNSFSINTNNLSSGIYFVNLIIDERSITKKVFVSK